MIIDYYSLTKSCFKCNFMLIGGLQKTTLLDYPDKIACIVFTVGCNFRCGFCHNPDLVTGSDKVELIPEAEVFKFFESRKGILDGVVITGGEPLLQKDLKDFIIKVKQVGLLVKLDTNGTSPDLLEELIDLKLIDYVAMDIKTFPEKYPQVVGTKVTIDDIKRSLEILLKNKVDCEFRTTIVAGLHTSEDLISIAKLITGAPRYFLQKFISSAKLLDQSFQDKNSLMMKDLEQVAMIAREYVKRCEIR